MVLLQKYKVVYKPGRHSPNGFTSVLYTQKQNTATVFDQHEEIVDKYEGFHASSQDMEDLVKEIKKEEKKMDKGKGRAKPREKKPKTKSDKEVVKYVYAPSTLPDKSAPSILAALQAIQKIQTSNSIEREATFRTISNIEARLKALTRDKNITASNFGASNFGASDYVQMMKSLGKNVPGDSIESMAELLNLVATGKMLHPKLIGGKGTSIVMKSVASMVLTLPTSGTGGYNNNDTIVIVTPNLQSYKGVIVFAINPITFAWRVIKYIAPDRDPEDLGTTLACLFTSLTFSSPLALSSAASVQITSQILAAKGCQSSNPIFNYPGKCSPVVIGKWAPTAPIGPNKQTIVWFNATAPIEDLTINSKMDPLNINLTYCPNAATQTQHTMSSHAEVSNPFRITCNAKSSAGLTNGFSAAVSGASAANTNLIIVEGSNQIIWNLKDVTDFGQHICFGDFRMNICFDMFPQAVNAGVNKFIMQVIVELDNGDGTDTVLSYNRIVAGSSQLGDNTIYNLHMNTHGDSAYAPYTGLVVRNISILLRAWAINNRFVLVCSENCNPLVDIVFSDISMNSQYLFAQLTGTREGFPITVDHVSHIEAFPRPQVAQAKFVYPTDDLAADYDRAKSVLDVGLEVGETGMVEASAFSSTMKKIANAGGKAFKFAARSGLVPDEYSETVENLGRGMRKVGGAAGRNKYGGSSSTDFTNYASSDFNGFEAMSFGQKIDSKTSININVVTAAESSLSSNFSTVRIHLANLLESTRSFLRVVQATKEHTGLGEILIQEYNRKLNLINELSKPFDIKSCDELQVLQEEDPIAVSKILYAISLLSDHSFTKSNTSVTSRFTELIKKFYDGDLSLLNFDDLIGFQVNGELLDGKVSLAADAVIQSYNLNASSFEGRPMNSNTTKFTYPGIRSEGDDHTFAEIPVVKKGTVDPLLASKLLSPCGSPSAGIKGRSGTLAQVFASINEAGLRVKSGLYSGEIMDLRRVDDNSFFMLLYPVAKMQEKVGDSIELGIQIKGLFVNGWFDGENFVDSPSMDEIFLEPQVSDFQCVVGKPTNGYPGPALLFYITVFDSRILKRLFL